MIRHLSRHWPGLHRLLALALLLVAVWLGWLVIERHNQPHAVSGGK